MPDDSPAERLETGAVVEDLNDLLGVEAAQMIAARKAADTALASSDLEGLALALDRMGVPAEDNPALLAEALLALPPVVQHRRLDQIELINTLPSDQAAVARDQRSRPPTTHPTDNPAGEQRRPRPLSEIRAALEGLPEGPITDTDLAAVGVTPDEYNDVGEDDYGVAERAARERAISDTARTLSVADAREILADEAERRDHARGCNLPVHNCADCSQEENRSFAEIEDRQISLAAAQRVITAADATAGHHTSGHAAPQAQQRQSGNTTAPAPGRLPQGHPARTAAAAVGPPPSASATTPPAVDPKRPHPPVAGASDQVHRSRPPSLR
jgi:hypothetical protein